MNPNQSRLRYASRPHGRRLEGALFPTTIPIPVGAGVGVGGARGCRGVSGCVIVGCGGDGGVVVDVDETDSVVVVGGEVRPVNEYVSTDLWWRSCLQV